MLKYFKIDLKKRIKTLSKGESEKYHLSLALSIEGQLYIMDEPLAAIDLISREEVISMILDNFNIEMLVSEQKGLYTSKICSKYKVFKILNRIYYDNCLALNRKNKTAQKIRKDIYDELF